MTVAECSYRVIARRSRGINSPADLKAKTIGTTRHTSAHYYLVQLAAKAGMREADLNAVDLQQAEMPAALERGAVDALSIWEPIAEAAAARLGADAVIFQDGALFRERFNLNTTTEGSWMIAAAAWPCLILCARSSRPPAIRAIHLLRCGRSLRQK